MPQGGCNALLCQAEPQRGVHLPSAAPEAQDEGLHVGCNSPVVHRVLKGSTAAALLIQDPLIQADVWRQLQSSAALYGRRSVLFRRGSPKPGRGAALRGGAVPCRAGRPGDGGSGPGSVRSVAVSAAGGGSRGGGVGRGGGRVGGGGIRSGGAAGLRGAGVGAVGRLLRRPAGLQLVVVPIRSAAAAARAAPAPPGRDARPAARLLLPVPAPSRPPPSQPGAVSAPLSAPCSGRCCRALRLGWRLCRTEPTGEERSHMAFVLHDISMLRLFETFLENAPQLAVLLYSVLRTNKAEPAQGMGICTAFLCVTWSLLDYHQSLRSFLQDKYEMGWGSSVIYFLWNLFLLCPRILALALFALLLPYGVAVHFLLVWLAMFIWVSLQGTDFMESPGPEQLYRAMVAVILYFSWFNVAPGRTLQRSIIYHSFILVDIALLSLAWLWGCPIEEQHPHLKPALWAALSCYVLGLLLRVTYYWWLHPNVRAQPPSGDEVDAHGRADGAVQFRSISEPCEPRGVSQPDLVNSRLRCLARTHFPLAALAEPRLLNGAAAV
uniref:XK-related protein n=1 Tax=Coturnix japonica TaxID=93934 RepID=A0A8C2TZ86_COTJA